MISNPCLSRLDRFTARLRTSFAKRLLSSPCLRILIFSSSHLCFCCARLSVTIFVFPARPRYGSNFPSPPPPLCASQPSYCLHWAHAAFIVHRSWLKKRLGEQTHWCRYYQKVLSAHECSMCRLRIVGASVSTATL